MTKVRFTETLKTRKANKLPGNTELVLTAPATDVTGTVHAKGTRIVPSAGGWDNMRNAQYQDVVVLG